MGCQKAIAQKQALAKADYVLALKGNHGILRKRVEETFNNPEHIRYLKDQDRIISHIDFNKKGHGRVGRRIVVDTAGSDFIDKKER